MNNIYDIWFSTLDIGNKIKYKMLSRKSVDEIWKINRTDLLEFNLSKKQIEEVLNVNKRINIGKYANYMEKNNIVLIKYDDDVFPENLKKIYDFPIYLYLRGNINNLYGENAAIVGSRMASEYGKKVSYNLAYYLSNHNVNVVSGLAYGIDEYAHLGSLKSNVGKTIAVLGTGVSDKEVYPCQNRKIFERILENGGTIISEYKLGSMPEKYHFPYRNRIISGLSKKIIVIEAGEKSGSLITANYALEQGKDIYAVPGNIYSKNSIGTNKLIEEGAYILYDFSKIFM